MNNFYNIKQLDLDKKYIIKIMPRNFSKYVKVMQLTKLIQNELKGSKEND